MPLTDTTLKHLKPRSKRYSVSDSRGLSIEIYPTGGMVWHYRYRLEGEQQRVTFGKYPDLPLKAARTKRDEFATQVALGKSPANEKRLARTGEGSKVSVKIFAARYYTDRVIPVVKNPASIKRYLDKDILLHIGDRPIGDVTLEEIRTLVFRKKDEGFEAAAGQIRGLLKRLFEYAVVRGVIQHNPALGLPMRFVSQPRSRTRALSKSELRIFLQTVYNSNIRRQFKLALHLILITMIRKNELLTAEWDEIDLEKGEWLIPSEHSKTGVPHTVYLSSQAKEIFQELKNLAGMSKLVMPGRASPAKPFAHNALNHALNGLHFDMPPFTIHDMRRTASTALNEAGYVSDVIEKALNHTMGGVRGVYNRAGYAEQRGKMLQHWADFVDGQIGGQNVVLGRFRTA